MLNTFFGKEVHDRSFTTRLKKVYRRKFLLYRVLFISFIIPALSGCSGYPPSDYYEVDGLVSAVLNDPTDSPGWKPVHFINSRGLADTSNRKPLTYSVYISTPGKYSTWLMAAYPGVRDTSASVDLAITGPENYLTAMASADIPEDNSLKWRRAETGTNSNLISFTDPGQYTITITAPGSAGVQLHKFQMSLNDTDQPFGLGLPSSKRTDLSAADLFRELPVMLPPAWVFNPVIGFDDASLNNRQQELVDEFINPLANPGGIWTQTDSGNNSIKMGDDESEGEPARGVKISVDSNCVTDPSNLFNQGFRFLVTQNSHEAKCLGRLHQQFQNASGEVLRSVFFHGIKDAYNADVKQYPAPITPEYEFKWSVSPRVEDDNYRPGGYAELVDDLSNPAGSLFNMPFLSMPMDYPDELAAGSDWDSELFIRSVQLSTFSPVMHLILPGAVDQLSSSERRQLLDAMYLRNSLFPYSYTHAHYTRQTNESVISGFRQYPDQFMYGDAFLVAPVMKPGTDGRIVYFPEGRRWYNYYTSEAFEAGQSWFVETQLDQLPLFVKAGAVIPYKINDDPEHLTIEIYTGDAGAFRLVEDDGVTRAYRRTDAARTMLRYNEVEGNLKFTIGAVQAGFEGMSDYRSYNIHFKYTEMPARVEINREELFQESALEGSNDSSWRFDEGKKEIILSLENISRHEKLDIVIYP